MTLPKHVSQETDVLRAVWIKAAEEGSVSLSFPTERACNQVKFKLYNAVKKFRDQPVGTSVLADAVRMCEVILPGDCTVVVRDRMSNPFVASIAEQMGMEAADIPTFELPGRRPAGHIPPAPPPIPDAQPSAEFLQAVVPRPANPFFTREEG